MTVEAEDGGRLFVSGKAAPGATVRLYLNESFIAPGGVGGDGQVSFQIARGVRPGDYRVRIDDVDPVSGAVKSRAEVAFNVPAPLTLPAPPAVAALPADQAPTSPQSAGLAPSPKVAAAPQQAAAAASPQPAPAAPAGAPAPGEAPSAAPRPAGNQVAVVAPGSRELPTGTIVIPDVNTTIVSRGDNLWRISQRVYGKGVRYTVIYTANRGPDPQPASDLPRPGFRRPGRAAGQEQLTPPRRPRRVNSSARSPICRSDPSSGPV